VKLDVAQPLPGLPWATERSLLPPRLTPRLSPKGMDITQIRDWAFIPGLPDETGPIRALLHTYSNIPQDEVDQHLLRIVRLLFFSSTKFFAYICSCNTC
jgi:hypothetical protein